jgi:catechol 2,3-dioxygenase
MTQTYTAPAKTTIGHVHLKVADIDRAMTFYVDVLGLNVKQRIGKSAVFLAAGHYHHHIGLNTWHSKNAPSAPERAAGLYHLALLYPTRRDLAEILQQLITAQWQIDGAADHGVSQAIYLRDPDNNGVELYWDRPMGEWPLDEHGELQMVNDPLDFDALLALLD